MKDCIASHKLIGVNKRIKPRHAMSQRLVAVRALFLKKNKCLQVDLNNACIPEPKGK
jgi:hypothetical protein